MIAVTAFNGYMAWVQDAELLALYAIVGGLTTPMLLSTGENHEITLFSYLLLLDVAVLVLVALRPWSRLLFGAFPGTVLFVTGWWFEFYSEGQVGRTALFLGCFFLIFAFAPRLVQAKTPEDAHFGGTALALVVLPVANAALGFLGILRIARPARGRLGQPWLAVAFAAFYLLLLRLPGQGRWKASPAVLSALHLAAAVVFLTIAIPLKASGRWITIGWLVEGAALLWVAMRTRCVCCACWRSFASCLGWSCYSLTIPPAAVTPIFNQRFGAYCVAIAVFAFAAWLALRAPAEEPGKTAFRCRHWPQSRRSL